MVTRAHKNIVGLADLRIDTGSSDVNSEPWMSVQADLTFGFATLSTKDYKFQLGAKAARLSLYMEGCDTKLGTRLNADTPNPIQVEMRTESEMTRIKGLKAKIAGLLSRDAAQAKAEGGGEYEKTSQLKRKSVAVSSQKISAVRATTDDSWEISERINPKLSLNGAYLNGHTLCETNINPSSNSRSIFGVVSVQKQDFSLIPEGGWLQRPIRSNFHKEKMLKIIIGNAVSSSVDQLELLDSTGSIIAATAEVNDGYLNEFE